MPEHVADTIRAYAAAFCRYDIDAVVSHFALPCLFVGPAGSTVVEDDRSARALVQRMLDQARASGLHHTASSPPVVQLLGSAHATARGVFTRLREDGSEIMRFGFFYLLCHADGRWRMIVAHGYEP